MCTRICCLERWYGGNAQDVTRCRSAAAATLPSKFPGYMLTTVSFALQVCSAAVGQLGTGDCIIQV